MSVQKQQLSLRWNNYVRHVTNIFDDLRNREDLIDVTLYCEGKKIRAHKMLLSACSTYFREVFKENPCQHPVVIFRNVQFEDLNAIIYFMYHGEVNIVKEQLASFLTTAELLEVQGLTDEYEDKDQDKHFIDNELQLEDNLVQEEISNSFPHTKKRKVSIKKHSTLHPNKWIDTSSNIINNSNVFKLEETINVENKTAVIIDTTIPNTTIIPFTEQGETCDSEVFLDTNLLNELKSTQEIQSIPGMSDEPQEIIDDPPSKESQDRDSVKFRCHQCWKGFKHPTSLTLHKDSHTGKTQCPICLRSFSRSYDMRCHLTKVHQDQISKQ